MFFVAKYVVGTIIVEGVLVYGYNFQKEFRAEYKRLKLQSV